jgi:hypothetical protein
MIIPKNYKICATCNKGFLATWPDDQEHCVDCKALSWRVNPETQKILDRLLTHF